MAQDAEIDIEVITTTPTAVLVTNGHIEAWLPKSCIKDYSEDSDGNWETIFITEYLANKKGLI